MLSWREYGTPQAMWLVSCAVRQAYPLSTPAGLDSDCLTAQRPGSGPVSNGLRHPQDPAPRSRKGVASTIEAIRDRCDGLHPRLRCYAVAATRLLSRPAALVRDSDCRWGRAGSATEKDARLAGGDVASGEGSAAGANDPLQQRQRLLRRPPGSACASGSSAYSAWVAAVSPFCKASAQISARLVAVCVSRLARR